MTLVFSILVIMSSLALAEDRQIIQHQLDEACEAARFEKLKPIREKYAAECVVEWDRSEEYCQRFYSDYGNRSDDRAALFYELPACEKAWKYRKSYRQAK